MDIGVPGNFLYSATADAVLRRFGLYRPFYPAQAKEYDHVQLIGSGVGPIIGAAAAAAIQRITAPRAGAAGAMHDLAQHSLDRIAHAANAMVARTAGAQGNRRMPPGIGSRGGVPPHKGPAALNRVPTSLRQYDHTFPMHHTGTAGAVLPPGVIARIARWAGLPGVTFEQITRGESSGMPGIVEWPPEADGAQGYGLWQLTTGHVDPPVVRLIKRLGGWMQMLNPFKNALATALLYRIGGIGRWHGTRYWDGTIRNFRSGGSVAGAGSGDTVSAMVEPGEHVWTRSEVQAAGGHSAMYAMRQRFQHGGPVLDPLTAHQLSTGMSGPGVSLHTESTALSAVAHAPKNVVGKAINAVLPTITQFQQVTLPGIVAAIQQMGASLQAWSTNMLYTWSHGKLVVHRAATSATGAAKLQVQSLASQLNASSELVTGLTGQVASLKQVVAQAKGKQKVTAQRALNTTRKELETAHETQAGLVQSYVTSLQALQQARVDTLGRRATMGHAGFMGTAQISSMRGIAQAKGDTGAMVGFDGALQATLTDQMQGLQKLLPTIKGNPQLKDQVQQQIWDLQVQIAQAAVSQVQDQIADTENRAGAKLSALQTTGAYASVLQAQGNLVGANALTVGNLTQQNSVLSGEKTEYQQEYAAAAAIGDVGDMQTLTQKMAQLDLTIAQNSQTIRDSNATLASSLDNLSDTIAGGAMNAISGGIAYLRQYGQIHNVDTTGAQLGLLGAGASALTAQRAGINTSIGQLLQDPEFATQGLAGMIGSLQTATGAQVFSTIASIISSAGFAALDPAEQQAFMTIALSLEQNTQAIQDNTQQTMELNGTLAQPQGFNTTMFNAFRASMFNGMGGLLPWAAATLQTNATGTVPMGSGASSVTGDTHVNVNLTSPTEVADPAHIGRAVAWSLKTP